MKKYEGGPMYRDATLRAKLHTSSVADEKAQIAAMLRATAMSDRGAT